MSDAGTRQTGTAVSGFSESWSGPVEEPEKVHDIDPRTLLENRPVTQLERMRDAGEELIDIYRVIAKTDDNIVGLLLAGQGTFYEWDHYPKGDVYDGETHCQYYYHAHRGATGEHGHFHTFQRAKGMPRPVAPLPLERDEPWPKGDEALAHLIAISMDKFGLPTHLFTTNRWVTAETLYSADDVIRMLDRFEMDLIQPSWPVNRWLSAMVTLFRPQIEVLLHMRDAVLRDRIAASPDTDVLEDRDLEITSMCRIDTDRQIETVRSLLS
ncbi:DUF6969 family protein [Minwuia sp.]|uniref:DUF6969 family protein n=1 Tax=Minwuia sp. TaxID=2493630 RepID=UPI003A9456F0